MVLSEVEMVGDDGAKMKIKGGYFYRVSFRERRKKRKKRG